MGNFYDLAQSRKYQLDRALKRIVELEVELEEKTAALLEADRDCRRYLDELDYVHQERDDAEKQLADRPAIPWLREVSPDRWEITDRD